MTRCEYCNRSAYLNDSETCKGCGAQLPPPQPAIVYDPERLQGLRSIGQPGVNIPINLTDVRTANLLDFYHRQLLTAREAFEAGFHLTNE